MPICLKPHNCLNMPNTIKQICIVFPYGRFTLLLSMAILVIYVNVIWTGLANTLTQ